MARLLKITLLSFILMAAGCCGDNRSLTPIKATSSWTPASRPLIIWFDGNNLGTAYANNDPVGSWADQSGNARNATAAAGNRPTYKTNVLNGKPVVGFSANKMDFGSTVLINTSSAMTLFAVVRNTSFVNNYPFLASLRYGVADNFEWFFSADANYQYMTYGSSLAWGPFRNSTTNPTTGWHYYMIKYSGSSPTSAGSWTYLIDNVSKTVSATGGAVGTSVQNNTLGSGTLSNFALAGDIAQLGIWSESLDATNTTAFVSWVNAQYGL